MATYHNTVTAYRPFLSKTDDSNQPHFSEHSDFSLQKDYESIANPACALLV